MEISGNKRELNHILVLKVGIQIISIIILHLAQQKHLTKMPNKEKQKFNVQSAWIISKEKLK